MRIHRIGQTKKVKIRRFIVKVPSCFSAINSLYTIRKPIIETMSKIRKRCCWVLIIRNLCEMFVLPLWILGNSWGENGGGSGEEAENDIRGFNRSRSTKCTSRGTQDVIYLKLLYKLFSSLERAWSLSYNSIYVNTGFVIFKRDDGQLSQF